MDYWIDEFTEETWDQFWEAGGHTSGWPEHYRKMVDNGVAQGDVLVCYVIGRQRWVGALKVLGASDDSRAIWGLDNEDHVKYPARLEVMPLVGLDVDLAIGMDRLKGKVGFFRGDTDKGKYQGFVRNSLVRFAENLDGAYLLRLIEKSSHDRLGTRDWTEEEIKLIVDDYFAALRAGSRGRIEDSGLLKTKLEGHDDFSIEFQRQNISAVLVGVGETYIKDYKPRGHYQKLLTDNVLWNLNISLLPLASGEGVLAVPSVSPGSWREARSDPPTLSRALGTDKSTSTRQFKVDSAERQKSNTDLGEAGEELVLRWEQQRLGEANLSGLAAQVKRVSINDDALGYDIQSFRGQGMTPRQQEEPVFIEVKTTTGNANRPFYVSSNELDCSRRKRDHYCLYRVYDFGKKPNYYILSGPLDDTCEMQPVTYTALPTRDGKVRK